MTEYETPAKDADEVFRRLSCIALLQILFYQVTLWPKSSGAERHELEAIYERFTRELLSEYADDLSPRERAIVTRSIGSWTEADEWNVGRLAECFAVLAWALHIEEHVPPFDEQYANIALLAQWNTADKRAKLAREVTLRSPAELGELEMVAEGWHWCARQARGHVSANMNQRNRKALARAVGEDV